MEQLWQTSAMRLADRSRISMWRIDGIPPNGQERACSTVSNVSQVQVERRLDGNQQYLRAIASRNAPLCKVKLFSSMGRVVNQLDAPFS